MVSSITFLKVTSTFKLQIVFNKLILVIKKYHTFVFLKNIQNYCTI